MKTSFLLFLLFMIPSSIAQTIRPVLEFPEAGIDDLSAYSGYKTRFYKDVDGNTLQISIDKNIGRVINLWADAVNESISFSVKDAVNNPVELSWDKPGGINSKDGKDRYFQYYLISSASDINIGLFLLGSMRVERDFRYSSRFELPLNTDSVFVQSELIGLIENIQKLPKEIQKKHLEDLDASSTGDLLKRLKPEIDYYKVQSKQSAIITQEYFDGKNHLSLEISINEKNTSMQIMPNMIHLKNSVGNPITFSIKIGTDSPFLTPLSRNDIFSDKFLNYYENERSKYFSLLPKSENLNKEEKDSLNRFRRMEREIKSLELLSSKEKLMAGLPNFATYFGRDMMMSALMMEPIWKGSMLENVIRSVLKKLRSDGNVSHEEGLGGQAIRENAGLYNALLKKYFSKEDKTNKDTLLLQSENILKNLNRTTENYRMMDDDFQLPVLTSHYILNKEFPVSQKLSFLKSEIEKGNYSSVLSLILKNFIYITKEITAYIKDPSVLNLVSFIKSDGSWESASWRDSRAGYANGRFAMDINVVWVPQALESIREIFAFLKENNFSIEDLIQLDPEIKESMLEEFFNNPEELKDALIKWEGAEKYFWTDLKWNDAQKKIDEKLNWLPPEESSYWKNILSRNSNENNDIKFLSLSLDENGDRIKIENTDPATSIFLNDFTDKILTGAINPDSVLNLINVFTIPYPAGLYVEGLGSLVANDTYSSKTIWETFKNDRYHSPYVVWGREMNLVFIGLSKQILSAYDDNGNLKDAKLQKYIDELKRRLEKIHTAVEQSGLKYNELWTYEIHNGKLYPKRYGTTSDIQLWNITNLSAEYLMKKIIPETMNK